MGLNLLTSDSILVPHNHLSEVTTEKMLARQKEIMHKMVEFHDLIPEQRSIELHTK
jgi:hypothetical protein